MSQKDYRGTIFIFKVFLKFDEDLDRYLNKNEFMAFLIYLNPLLLQKDRENIFKMTNISNLGKVNFTEFKEAFKNIMLICRIKDVFVDVKKLDISDNLEKN